MGKKECAKCGVITSYQKLVTYRTTGEKRCSRCIKKYGQNPFYEPKVNGYEKKNQFHQLTLSDDERNAVWKQSINKGIDENIVKEKIKRINNYQYYLQRQRMIPQKETQKTLSKSKFLEGLRS